MIAAKSFPIDAWVEDIKAKHQLDSTLSSLLSSIASDPTSYPQYSIVEGLLSYKVRIVLSPSSSLYSDVLTFMHASPIVGHSNF